MTQRWRRTGRTIGAGGQAQVFAVVDERQELDGEYAMKVLTNQHRVGRIDLEISTTKSLYRGGARVLPILDDYTSTELAPNERPWFVTPIVQGGSLASSLVPGEPWGGDPVSALDLFGQISGAVLQIHELGVAHRDLKPSNVLLSSDGPLLCDLGLCLPLDAGPPEERLTGDLERIGSIHYIPKEAFGPRGVDQGQLAFDAFALGKILYELLAGRVLPGYTPAHDPDYDLTTLRDAPFYAGVNMLLRRLLHDSPDRRLEALGDLPDQVNALKEWAEEPDADSLGEQFVREMAAVGVEISRSLTLRPPLEATEEEKRFCEELATNVMRRWESSKEIEAIRDTLVASHSELLKWDRFPTKPHLRGVVLGPYKKSRRGLEGLEDRGYPARPETESGASLALVPLGPLAGSLPSLVLGMLVGVKAGKAAVGVAVARLNEQGTSYCDLVPSTETVISGGLDDAGFMKAAVDEAGSASRAFYREVRKLIESSLTTEEEQDGVD